MQQVTALVSEALKELFSLKIFIFFFKIKIAHTHNMDKRLLGVLNARENKSNRTFLSC